LRQVSKLIRRYRKQANKQTNKQKHPVKWRHTCGVGKMICLRFVECVSRGKFYIMLKNNALRQFVLLGCST
jgi:hypothetical protein